MVLDYAHLVDLGGMTLNVKDILYGSTSIGVQGTPSIDTKLTKNIVYSGPYSTAQEWFSVNGNTLTGTVNAVAGSTVAPVNIYVGFDTVDTTTLGPGNLDVLAVTHATSGGTGGRTVIQASENIVGTPTLINNAGYTALAGITRVSVNMGGTTGAYGNYKGPVFGGNFNAFSTPGATFLTILNAQENDVQLGTGSSAAEKHGLTVVLGSGDVVRGTYDDNAIQIASGDNVSAVGWKTGLMFGAYAHQWSFATDSTLIGAQTRQVGPASTSVAQYGVDWTAVTFTTGGAPFLAPLITPASSSATGKQGSITWDANYIYICTATNTWKRAALTTF